jgi:hypothetical protein
MLDIFYAIKDSIQYSIYSNQRIRYLNPGAMVPEESVRHDCDEHEKGLTLIHGEFQLKSDYHQSTLFTVKL